MEAVSSRITRLQQLLSGRTPGRNRVPMLDKDTLLDALLVLYNESSSEKMMKDKNIATFVKKFKSVIEELISLRIKYSDFEIRKTIGRGHFGEVHVVREKVTGNVYAMKVLRKSETLSQDNVAFFEEEKDIMAFANNKWVTSLQYAFQDSENLYLVMDYHPGGDLLGLLAKYDDILEEDMARFYLAEMIMAIHSVHTLGYVHRDIKPENVLIDRTGHIKLVDFGSSAKLSSTKLVVSKMPVGTPEYIAPEVLTSMDGSGGKYGIECDWWSLGVVMYEMLVGNTPFEADSVVVVYSQIMNYKTSLKFPDDLTISDDAKGLMRALLTDRKERIGYEGLANHSFFKGLDWTTLQDAVPPYVPTLHGIDDTSNFDDFEPESSGPRIEDFMKGKEGFNGKDLPFIGFTFTRQFLCQNESRGNEPTSPVSKSAPSFSSRSSVKSQELKDAQQSAVASKIELEQAQKQIEELKKSLESKDRMVKKVEDERDIAEKEKVLFDTEIKSLQRRLDLERSDRQKAENEAMKLLDEVRKSSRKAEELRDQELRNSLEEQKQLVAQLEQDRFVANKRAQHLEQELNEKKKTLEDNKTHVADLKAKLAKVNEETMSSVSDLQLKLQKVTDDSEARVKEFQEKLTKAIASFKESSDRLQNVEREKDEIQKELDELKVLEDQYKQREAEVNCKPQQATETESFLQEEVKAKSERCSLLEKEVSNLKSQLDESEVRYEKLLEVGEEMKKELTKKIEDLENALNTAKKGQKKLEMEHKKLQEDFEDKNQNLESKERTIDSLKVTCRKLEEQVQEVMANKESEAKKKIEGDKIALQKQLSDFKHQQTRLESNYDLLKKELEAQRQTNANAKKRLEEAQKQLQEATDQYESRISKLQKDLTKAKEEASKATKDLAATRKSADNLNHKINQLMIEVEAKSSVPDSQAGKSKANPELESKLKKTLKELNELKVEKKSLDAKLKMANKHLTSLKVEKEELEEELKEKERQSSSTDLTIQMLKQTCTMLEGQVEELEVMNDEYQDREEQWNVLKRQLYDAQEKYENQLTETMQHLEQERSKRLEAATKSQNVEENIDDLKRDHNRKIEQMETNLRQQSDRIKELTDLIAEAEKKQALSEVSFKTMERRLETEAEEKSKINAELSKLSTFVSSQKSSNFHLSQELETTQERINELQVEKENLSNQLERTAYAHAEEKIKLESQLSQQTKLIDFLQAKVEESKGKKKGFPQMIKAKDKPRQQEQTSTISRRQRDLERALDKEKNNNLQLHLQLKSAKEELQSVKTELAKIKSSVKTANISDPTTPTLKHKDPESVILLQQSAGSQENNIASRQVSPSTSVADIYSSESVKANDIRHSPVANPHKLQQTLNMRPARCPICLYNVHFGKQVTRCIECKIVCHSRCAPSLGTNCGAPDQSPSRINRRYRTNRPPSTIKKLADTLISTSSLDSEDGGETFKVEGWMKIPRKGTAVKQGWDRKWIVLEDRKLSIYDNENTIEFSPHETINLDIKDGEVIIHPAVAASEILGTASTDLPYTLSIELSSNTSKLSGRTLYLLAPTFSDKQKWVTALEYAIDTIKGPDKSIESIPPGKSILHLEGKEKIDVNCCAVLGNQLMLIGADEGLHGVSMNAGPKKTLVEISGLDHVYHIEILGKLGIAIIIAGRERTLCKLCLNELHEEWKKVGSRTQIQGLKTKEIEKMKSCHIVTSNMIDGEYYACVASTKRISLLRYANSLGTFVIKKEFETSDPCGCLRFSQRGILFGTNKFFIADIKQFNHKDFLDSSDTSLAFAVFGTAQMQNFPVAVFSVKNRANKEEFLLCYNEFAVFVDADGRRSRPSDMKWKKLPMAFVYKEPFLYVIHFNSLEVCEVPLDTNIDVSNFKRKVVDIPKPNYLGIDVTTASIIISSPQGDSIDLISFHGNTLSGFSNIVIVPGSPGGATSMPDITRSTSNHSICSDEETSRQIARQTSPVLFRKRLDTKTEKKENRGSFKIPFSFKGSKRSSQIE